MAVPSPTAAASRGRRLDRDQVLARVELRAVADSLLGPAARQGGQLRWPCPHAEHPAPTSDRSGQPTLKITGPQTWKCQAEGCEAWGSAIDLVMHTQGRNFREALRILDERAGAFRTRPPRLTSQGGRVQRVGLAQLKARVDLVELADRLLGPGKGRGRGRGWPCPHPQHPGQTGRTPPLKIRRGSDGLQRWKCFGCGAGGDAIDLVELTLQRDTGEAIRYLRDLVGDGAVAPPPRRPVPPAPRRAKLSPVLGGYVDQCQQLLWAREGALGRDYLMKRRGLSEQILRANRVGYDPGPALLPRPRGLPRGGRAAVFPVLDSQSHAVYLQVRYLSPWEDRRYQSPREELAGPSPRMTVMRLAGPAADAQTVLICEGFIDALSAAQAGYTSVAVLGASAPDETTARAVADRFPSQRLAIVFDDDPGGHLNATRLAELLAGSGAGDRITVLRPQQGDLNGWLTADPQAFAAALRRLTTPEVAPGTPASGAQPSPAPGSRPRMASPGVGAVEL